MEKLDIAVGFHKDNKLYSHIDLLKNKANKVEVYYDLKQYEDSEEVLCEVLKKADKTNLIYSHIPNKFDFLRNIDVNVKKIKSLNPQPDYITTSLYTFGKKLIQEGYKVEDSIVNGIDTIEKIDKLIKLGYSGFSIAAHKINDLNFLKAIKENFSNKIRIKAVANMSCEFCIFYKEKHELFYFNDDKELTKSILSNDLGPICDLNPLKYRFVMPSEHDEYNKYIDTFKFASRKPGKIMMEIILDFLNKDDFNFIKKILTFKNSKDLKKLGANEVVNFILDNRIKNCSCNCYSCKSNCDELWRNFKK